LDAFETKALEEGGKLGFNKEMLVSEYDGPYFAVLNKLEATVCELENANRRLLATEEEGQGHVAVQPNV